MNRLSDCYFMPNKKFFSYIMAKTSYIQWDDYDVRFVLDQHNELDFHSASSLQQQSNDRHVAPLGHIILILSETIFTFPLNAAYLMEKQQIPTIQSLIWPVLIGQLHLQLSDLPYLECDICWLYLQLSDFLTLNVAFVDYSTTEWSPLSRMWHLLTILQLSDLPYLECDICWLFFYNWVISLTLNVTFDLLTVHLQLSDLPYLKCDIYWLFIYNWVISLI
jgi:hypothetical protein